MRKHKQLSKKNKNTQKHKYNTHKFLYKIRGGSGINAALLNFVVGNKIQFIFINLNDYTEEEKDIQIKNIDDLLIKTNTNNNDNSFFKKNALRFMKDIYLLYMLYEEQIIGIIFGNITDDNYIYISHIEIRKRYLNKTYKDIGISGRSLLTEYINTVTSKYKNVIGFKLFNAGGINSCFLYKKIFTELGYKIEEPEHINCNTNDFIDMKFIKIQKYNN